MSAKSERIMTDSRGNAVPVRYVSKVDKERDRVVRGLFKQARKLNADLSAFKLACMEAIDIYVDWVSVTEGVAIGGVKGNVKLSTFDGTLQITRMRQDSIEFDERLQVAQGLIKEYVAEKAAGIDRDLQVLIDDAFNGANGRLNAARVLGLFKLKIGGEKWAKAMELIRESIRVSSTREYARFYERAGGAGEEYKHLPLDIAAV